jgi:hypothetical protein
MKLVTGDADAKSVTVRGYAQYPLPQGGMINGIITDEEMMTRFFAEINNSLELGREDTQLVINSNNIQAKSLEVPPVSEDMVLEFIGREYGQHADESEGASVYDYTVLSPHGPNGGTQILAVGASRELLASYKSVLTGAGFALSKIDIGLNCQIKLARFMPQLQEGSVILALIDGRSLSLTLFTDGMYVVSNRYRLVHPEGEPEWTDEIGGNISSMIQFGKTQKDSAEISAAFIAGASEQHTNSLRFALGYLGISITGLDMSEYVRLQSDAAGGGAPFDAGSYLLNIGNLLKR